MIAPDEWDTLCLLIEEGWPGEFTDASAVAWRLLLDDYDAAQVLMALKALVARGGTFRPSVAELVAQIVQDPDEPTFAEMIQSIFGPGGVLAARTAVRKPWWEAGERERLNDEAALERAAGMHRLIAGFVRDQGLAGLRRLHVDNAEWGAARRKQLANAWEEFCDRAKTRDIAALVSGPRRGRLGRFDPLRALPAVGLVHDREAL